MFSIYLQISRLYYSDRPKADVLALSLYKAGGMVDEWAKLAPSSLSLGGGFKYFLFSPLFREMIQFDYILFKWVETTN